MLEISIMDVSVSILPFSYVVDICILGIHIYIFIHSVAIVRILWWGCMQTTVFITPLDFHFNEKNLMLLVNIFQLQSFSCYKMIADGSKTSFCSKKIWCFLFHVISTWWYRHCLSVTLNDMVLLRKPRLDFDYVWQDLCRNKFTLSFRTQNIK